jgi:hypothetical protein
MTTLSELVNTTTKIDMESNTKRCHGCVVPAILPKVL